MAANFQSRQLVSFGRRLFNQVRAEGSRDPTRSPTLTAGRRTVHGSVYDKNVDEQVRPAVVPDYLIQSQSDKYWAPHPQTGVFGPPAEHNPSAGVERGFHLSTGNGGEDSALEQKAFFRPLENLEKPTNP